MKKLLKAILSFALVICCFGFVGCDIGKKESPATIEGTIKIIENFASDVTAIKSKLESENYEYPTTEAIQSSTPVRSTDKSKIGIDYSNYLDFDYNYNFNQGDNYNPYSVGNEFYPDITDTLFYTTSTYLNIYKENNFGLGKIYKITTTDGGEISGTECIRLTNDNKEIKFNITKTVFSEENFNVYIEIKIIINGNSWKSVECSQYDADDEGIYYFYAEKSTNESRLFDNLYEFDTYNDEYYGKTEITFFDINEKVQKMTYMKFYNDDMTLAESTVYVYLQNLHLETLLEVVDIEQAIETNVVIEE